MLHVGHRVWSFIKLTSTSYNVLQGAVPQVKATNGSCSCTRFLKTAAVRNNILALIMVELLPSVLMDADTEACSHEVRDKQPSLQNLR